jgi:hypothetical protein
MMAPRIFLPLLWFITGARPIKDDEKKLHFLYSFYIFISFPHFSHISFGFFCSIVVPFPFSLSFTLKTFLSPRSSVLCPVHTFVSFPPLSFVVFPTSFICRSYRHSSLHTLGMEEDSSRFPLIHSNGALGFPRACRCFGFCFLTEGYFLLF